MQTREKNLAIALAGVVGVMGVWTIVKPWYMGPIDTEAGQLAMVQTELDGLENQQMQLLAATQRLADWKAQSLPPDPKPAGRGRPDALNGQRLYQHWLTDLARQAGFLNPEVTPRVTKAVQDVYVTAQVQLTGQATYGQLCRFLAMFENTDLLHRIESCRIESSNYRGDPLLSISLTAEGVALQNAPIRDELFPETQLAAPIKASETKLTVADADGFPESGRFEIRVGEERISVVSVKGNEWQVNRGKDQTEPADHAEGRRVDLGLYNALAVDESAREPHPLLAMISEVNPFTIPAPPNVYQPELDLPGETVVYLGSDLDLAVNAKDFDPNYGPPKFELVGDVPKGMELKTSEDAFSSLITWRPEEESQIGSYPVEVQVSRSDLSEPIRQSVRVVVQERNAPPILQGPQRLVVYSGQPLEFQVTAKDDNLKQRLSFSLGEGAPPEATIDPTTGEFSWTPPGAVTEQSFELEVIATDDGNPPEKGSVRIPIEVEADLAHFTRYLGSVVNGSRGEAWFHDRWNNREFVMEQGDVLEFADIKAEVMEVHPDQLILSRDGETWVLEAGRDVREMTRRESAKTAQSK